MKNVLVILASLLLLSACSNRMKQKIGIATSGPNEYAVEKNRPLEVPPHFDLPEPKSLQISE
ncbi:MAG: hypothetical protein RLZZ59_150 [Pseudomonadota bacterium]|jgi:uncharacterized protein YceK